MLGSDGQIRILDFGIGSLLAETEGESLVDTMSTANSVSSGLDCASPESIMDPTNLTPAGDQYSLGCVLYFCLTGRYPFPDGSAVEKMMAHQFKEPDSLSELNASIPKPLVELVEKLMQKKPEDRFSSTAEAIQALQAFAANPSASPRKSAANGEARKETRRDNGHRAPAVVKETPRAPAIVKETPRPVNRPTPATAPRVQALPASAPARKPAAPKAPIARKPAPKVHEEQYQAPPGGLDDFENGDDGVPRFGPLGLVCAACLVCVLVWLLTAKLF